MAPKRPPIEFSRSLLDEYFLRLARQRNGSTGVVLAHTSSGTDVCRQI
jgi:hypothetical protein